MTNSAPYDHIVFTEFDDSEGILVDLNTKKYYQLNETAMLIWKGLEEGLAMEEIAERLASEYEVTPVTARENVEHLLNELSNYKLIQSN